MCCNSGANRSKYRPPVTNNAANGRIGANQQEAVRLQQARMQQILQQRITQKTNSPKRNFR